MKKIKAISLVACSLLLAACGTNEPATSETNNSQATSSAPLSGTTSLPDEAKTLITANDENSPMPTYDEASKTYIFEVGETKRSYTISGEFVGRFLINDTTLTDYKGITFKLNNATLTNTDEGGSVFVYQPHSKALTIEALSGTSNSILANATAVSCVNNVNICGDGSLSIKSETEHGVKGDDVRLYGAVALSVEGSGKDGLHGKNFYTDDGGDGAEKKIFNGTISMKDIAKQAFDFTDEDDWSGTIELISTSKVTVESCENVFKSDSKIVLDGEVTATGITDKAITKDKSNVNNMMVLISGDVSFNGTTIGKGTYDY